MNLALVPLFNILLISALSPLVVGVIRKLKARMQSREGASVFQPYRNLVKLFHKDETVSEDASWVFLAAPYIIFGTTLALAAGVPLIGAFAGFPTGDIIVFAYLLAAGTFFLALGGIDTGGGFGGFGASREMMIASLTEGGLILSLVGTAFLAGTTDLAGIALGIQHVPLSGLTPVVLAATAFFLALLAENTRYPVDNPATHLELTMVHEAMILEYSGKRLALLEWAAANKLLIFITVFVNIFAPWMLPVSFAAGAIFAGLAVFFLKMLAVAGAIAFIESTMAKFRIFRVPDFVITSFVLSVIAILIVVV
ncbi:NADH-quinone oxidoreductase subunit H [Candidatus Kaiserbacteria bacterium]|nr:NADH-quinone oxidoreductase subunit H [Candidatus Kaiserbacteria bacterium]